MDFNKSNAFVEIWFIWLERRNGLFLSDGFGRSFSFPIEQIILDLFFYFFEVVLLLHGFTIMPLAKAFYTVLNIEFHEIVLLFIGKVGAFKFEIDIFVDGLLFFQVFIFDDPLRFHHQFFLRLLFCFLYVLVFPIVDVETFT